MRALRLLKIRLEPNKVTNEAIDHPVNLRKREGRVRVFVGTGVESVERAEVGPGLEREVAAHDVRVGIRDREVAEPAVGDLEVVGGVAPSAESAA